MQFSLWTRCWTTDGRLREIKLVDLSTETLPYVLKYSSITGDSVSLGVFVPESVECMELILRKDS